MVLKKKLFFIFVIGAGFFLLKGFDKNKDDLSFNPIEKTELSAPAASEHEEYTSNKETQSKIHEEDASRMPKDRLWTWEETKTWFQHFEPILSIILEKIKITENILETINQFCFKSYEALSNYDQHDRCFNEFGSMSNFVLAEFCHAQIVQQNPSSIKVCQQIQWATTSMAQLRCKTEDEIHQNSANKDFCSWTSQDLWIEIPELGEIVSTPFRAACQRGDEKACSRLAQVAPSVQEQILSAKKACDFGYTFGCGRLAHLLEDPEEKLFYQIKSCQLKSLLDCETALKTTDVRNNPELQASVYGYYKSFCFHEADGDKAYWNCEKLLTFSSKNSSPYKLSSKELAKAYQVLCQYDNTYYISKVVNHCKTYLKIAGKLNLPDHEIADTLSNSCDIYSNRIVEPREKNRRSLSSDDFIVVTKKDPRFLKICESYLGPR